jgi:ferritin-like metal-binding protein YciE
MKPLEKVFWDELAEMLHVEELLLKSLPKMKEAALSGDLKEALEEYRTEVQTQSKRVRDLFQLFEVPPREKKCDAMMGLLTRGQQLMQRSGPGAALDAALICQTRKIVGYKVAAYSTMAAWAKCLQEKEAARALEKSTNFETSSLQVIDALVADCNSEATKQIEESARRPVPRVAKKTREFAEGSRWGDW